MLLKDPMPNSCDTTHFPSLKRRIPFSCFPLWFTYPLQIEPSPMLIHGQSACKSQNKIKLLLLAIPVSSAAHLTLFSGAYTHHEEKMKS